MAENLPVCCFENWNPLLDEATGLRASDLQHFSHRPVYAEAVLPSNLASLDVGASDGAGASRATGENLGTLLDIYDGSATNGNLGSPRDGVSIREFDLAEISELDLGAARLEVLDNPFCIFLTKLSLGAFPRERVGDAFAGGHVLKGGSSSGLAGGLDSSLDGVASRDGDAGEIVGVVRVPLIPSVIT